MGFTRVSDRRMTKFGAEVQALPLPWQHIGQNSSNCPYKTCNVSHVSNGPLRKSCSGKNSVEENLIRLKPFSIDARPT